ncbi:MAG: hypothetical protein JW892_02755 [Anaerolineae bacterium]|nr:hypothetical protein [Anaerolineae bacterium]
MLRTLPILLVSIMVIIPFTPPHVSVNRVRIADLPGLPLDDAVRGQAAYHLLSKEAVVRYALEQADLLHLPPSLSGDSPAAQRDLPLVVDRALFSPKSAERAAADRIARRLGHNLAYILLTLHRGDACNRALRPDWTAAEWDYWASVRSVRLGGGLVSGTLGKRLVEYATMLIAELGYADTLRVELTPYRGEMSLLGAGRYTPEDVPSALCFDFGQTLIKRAQLHLEHSAITAFEVLPSLPTEWAFSNVPTAALRYSGEEVLALVSSVLARTAVETGMQDAEMLISIAAYVDAGRLLGNGIYARMSTLADDVRPLVAAAVQARSGVTSRIHLIHDGTAAAALHASEPHTAVIVVGTALGVGFCPSTATGLRPLRLASPEM